MKDDDCFPKYGGPKVNVKVGDIVYYFNLDEGIQEYIIESIDGNYLWCTDGSGIHSYWIDESHFTNKSVCVEKAIEESVTQINHFTSIITTLIKERW